MRGRLVAPLAVAALGIGACGEEEGGDAALEPAVPANVPTETTATETATTRGKPFELASIKVSKDTSKKPTITKPSGDPPTKLVTKDIVESARAPRPRPETSSRCTTSERCSTASSSRRHGTRASRFR